MIVSLGEIFSNPTHAKAEIRPFLIVFDDFALDTYCRTIRGKVNVEEIDRLLFWRLIPEWCAGRRRKVVGEGIEQWPNNLANVYRLRISQKWFLCCHFCHVFSHQFSYRRWLGMELQLQSLCLFPNGITKERQLPIWCCGKSSGDCRKLLTRKQQSDWL